MKTTFEYDHDAAVAKCCEYSSDPDTLRSLIKRLTISVGPHTVIPSPWHEGGGRRLNALHMLVTVEGFTFAYHGSHNDAETMSMTLQYFGWTPDEKRKVRANLQARKDFKVGLLYSILCCIRGDIDCTLYDPEEMGFDSDSIKDMARWNEIREHASKLRSALRLTPEELESLPQ